MKEKVEQGLRLLAYAAVIAFLGLRGYAFFTERAAPNPQQMAAQLVGKALPITGSKLEFAPATAVLVMSTSCHFCTASAPFYRKLMSKVSSQTKGHSKVVAVLPEAPEVSKAYTKSLDVQFDDVLQGQVSGVWATPTILLADAGGIVRKVWVGTLPSSGEDEVLSFLSEPASR